MEQNLDPMEDEEEGSLEEILEERNDKKFNPEPGKGKESVNTEDRIQLINEKNMRTKFLGRQRQPIGTPLRQTRQWIEENKNGESNDSGNQTKRESTKGGHDGDIAPRNGAADDPSEVRTERL